MRGKASLVSRLLCVVFLLLFSRTAAANGVIYVDADAPGANNGSSWENAYVFLQDALAEAEIAEKPIEIRVAQGIYKPDQGANQLPGDRDATFQLIDGVILKGGYEGFGGIDPNVRDIRSNETILSGDLVGDDISWNELLEIRDISNYYFNTSTFDEPNKEDNTYHVVLGSDTDVTAGLDGFTITGGCAAGFYYSGGGMYNDAGSPTIVDCTFTRNLAYYSGGGLYCWNNSNPTLTNCTISKNWALYGGGMDNEDSNPSLNNCTFTENFSEVHYDAIVEPGYSTCGGMYNTYSNPTLTHCTFSENFTGWISGDSVGGMLNYQSNPNMTNCIFTGNTGVRGGGIYNKGSNPILTNCVFIGNFATKAYISGGGAIFNDSIFYLDHSWTPHLIDSNPILANCIFIGNLAEDGAGIYNLGSSRLILSNCIFSSNKAISSGGGIYNRGGRAILTNCTFVQNSAQNGNAVACDEYYVLRYSIPDSNVELINCILWNGGNEIWNNDSSIIDISYSDIQGGQAGIFDPCEAVIWGEGNIDADPCFVNPGYWADADNPNIVVEPNDPNAVWVDGDYHLKSQAGRWDPVSKSWVIDDVTSPCIDAGDPNSPVAFEPFPNGGIINMGAYGGTTEASKSPSGLHAKYGGGSGTTEDPYLIYTAEQMNKIGLYQEDWYRHFKLMMDINLIDFKGSLYNIIGNEYYPFKGTFDGNGHTISNFTYSSTNSSWIGIFGYVSEPNACIKKLGLVNPKIHVRHISTVGSLAGGLYTGIITNCYVTNSNISAEGFVGGLVGQNLGVVSDCHVNGTITGIYRIGGLIGVNQSISRDDIDKRSGVVQRCYSQASISGQSEVGGLIGYNGEGKVTDCSSTIDITGDNGIGGLVGVNTGLIENCYSHGSLEAQKLIGGLIGVNDGIIRSSYSDTSIEGGIIVGGLVGENYSGEIINCYARGDITGNSYVGGLVGSNTVTKSGHIIIVRSGTVQNCYSTAVVSGDRDTGGFVGRNEEDGISNSFWDIETSGLTTSYGGEGKTTVEMQIARTFLNAGWDFADEIENGTEDIWWILEGQDYPRLWWELINEK